MAGSLPQMVSTAYQAVLDCPVGPFVQELLVLAVFGLSYLLWKQLRERHPRSRHSAKGKAEPMMAADFARSPSQVRRRVPVTAEKEPASAQTVALEKQMITHLDHREFTRALNMYRTLEREGRTRDFSEDLYSAFVQSAIRVGKIDVVERMMRNMKHYGVAPSLKFWQTTLKMLSSRKFFPACLSVQMIFGRQIPCDKVIFSCLINAALEVGDPERASIMLDRYRDADLEAKDHVLFFRTYATLNDMDAAEAIFKQLGSDVTTLMLNLMLLTCVNAKHPERGLRLLREAHALEKPDSQERLVDVVSYNTLLKGFAMGADPTKCFECLNEMIDKRIEPDDITFGTLLDACLTDNHMDAAQEIVNLLMRSGRAIDTVMCTLFIKSLVRANCLPQALRLCKEMTHRKTAHPDVITYSVLIKALVDRHDLDGALDLVEDMKQGGHQPDDIILTHLLEGCRHASNLELGKKLFDEMLDNGVKPSEFTLVTMLKLHGRCGAHQEAHDLVAGWEEAHGAQPSVIHYTCLMSGCMRTKSYDKAWSAYELMCKNGVRPDSTTLSTLLPGMVAAQKWESVLQLARAATADGKSSVPAESLNSALTQMQSAGGHCRMVEQLTECMHHAGVVVTTRHRDMRSLSGRSQSSVGKTASWKS